MEPSTAHEWERYHEIRYESLRRPHGQPRGSEQDHPLEPISRHLIAKVGPEVVAGGCWALLTRPDGRGGRYRYARFRHVAVDPRFRGLGIAAKVIDRIDELAAAEGALEVRAAIRKELTEYFRARGCQILEPADALFGSVEHVNIVKPLPSRAVVAPQPQPHPHPGLRRP